MKQPTLILFSLAVTLLQVSSQAFAQTPALAPAEKKARDALISQAQDAHAAKNHKSALEIGERAAQIQQSPSLRYFLAFEQQELGMVAEAFNNAQQCAREFESDTALAQRKQFLARCKTLRDRLAKQVGYVVLAVPETPAGLMVKIAGRDVPAALFGLPYLVTPGVTAVEATAPGRVPFRQDVIVTAGPAAEVKIALAADVVAACPAGFVRQGAACVLGPNAAALAATGGGGAGSSSASFALPGGAAAGLSQSAEGERRYGNLGKILAIAGGAVAVAGIATWAVSHSEYNSTLDRCEREGCSEPDAREGRNTVRTLDRVALGVGLLGGAMLVTSSVLYLGGKW